jgi:imidazolonepropionase-like amidohydrolase
MRYFMFGMKKILLLATCLVIISCQSGNQVSGLKVLIGGTAIMQAGANPVQDAVIVISGDTIRAAGVRKDVPIPQDSERTDLTGKWVVPVAGGRIAPGEAADLFILNTSPSGAPTEGTPARRMIHGQWN